MKRILYIKPGYVPAPSNEEFDEFYYLSNVIAGDVLLPVWGEHASNTFQRENFTYHYFFSWKFPKIIRLPLDILFYICKGLYINYKKSPYDAIISYGTNKTGIAALILKYLTKSKLIVDVPGNPAHAYTFDSTKQSLFLKLKQILSEKIFKVVVRRADVVKLLYPTQLDYFPDLKIKQKAIFHAFVPVSQFKPSSVDEKFIICVGFPYYLKGVDVLIKAFHIVKKEFPEYRLKIIGHCEDRSYFKNLADNDPRIEFYPGLPFKDVQKQIASSTMLVLPSRTETMGRVLLEAMAHGKPVIGSRVDGIPYVIEDGVNGLLFESENSVDLSRKIVEIIEGFELRNFLKMNAKQSINSKYTENSYINRVKVMVESL